MVIRYENLGVAERRQIWTQFFDKLSNDRQEFVITRRAKNYVLEDEALETMRWNGREIRNGNVPKTLAFGLTLTNVI